MNRRFLGVVGVLTLTVLALGGCKSDPLSDLDGAPAALAVDFEHLNIVVGNSAAVTASVLDGRSTPLLEPVSFAACGPEVTAVPDTSYHPVPATSGRAVVTAVAPATSCVVVTGAGLTDTVTVESVP